MAKLIYSKCVRSTHIHYNIQRIITNFTVYIQKQAYLFDYPYNVFDQSSDSKLKSYFQIYLDLWIIQKFTVWILNIKSLTIREISSVENSVNIIQSKQASKFCIKVLNHFCQTNLKPIFTRHFLLCNKINKGIALEKCRACMMLFRDFYHITLFSSFMVTL